MGVTWSRDNVLGNGIVLIVKLACIKIKKHSYGQELLREEPHDAMLGEI